MPTVNGRYVPTGHQAAIAAGVDDAPAADADAPAPKKKKATRTRARKKVETAMTEMPDT